MRSSYNALDELDCVAMDQFQRDFFLFRQSEYAFYTQHLGGQGGIVQQGMLQDPYYFDFISFAQYATIAREMSQNPQLLFEEVRMPLSLQSHLWGGNSDVVTPYQTIELQVIVKLIQTFLFHW